jgi:hypothetical protein
MEGICLVSDIDLFRKTCTLANNCTDRRMYR